MFAIIAAILLFLVAFLKIIDSGDAKLFSILTYIAVGFWALHFGWRYWPARMTRPPEG